MECLTQETLNKIFPPDRADAFFEALYGGAEEGAYDIALVCRNVTSNKATLAFELRRRPDKCLKCSLTYGLPKVFEKHPVINLVELSKAIASELKWEDSAWELFPVEEISDDLHIIPFEIYKR